MMIWVVVFCSILAALVLVFLFFCLRYLLRRNASRAWPETIGIITKSQIGCIPASLAHDDDVYSADFTFNYKVPGSELHGNFSINNLGGSSGVARRSIADHPVGTAFKVRYNPENPEEYFTELDGPDTVFWFYFISFLLFLILLLLGIWYSLQMTLSELISAAVIRVVNMRLDFLL